VETSAAETAGAPFVWLERSDGDTPVYGSVGKKLAWFKPDKWLWRHGSASLTTGYANAAYGAGGHGQIGNQKSETRNWKL